MILRSFKKLLILYQQDNRKNNKSPKRFKKVKKDTLRKNKIKNIKRNLLLKIKKHLKISNKQFLKFNLFQKKNYQRKKPKDMKMIGNTYKTKQKAKALSKWRVFWNRLVDWKMNRIKKRSHPVDFQHKSIKKLNYPLIQKIKELIFHRKKLQNQVKKNHKSPAKRRKWKLVTMMKLICLSNTKYHCKSQKGIKIELLNSQIQLKEERVHTWVEWKISPEKPKKKTKTGNKVLKKKEKQGLVLRNDLSHQFYICFQNPIFYKSK